jgi:hypothetical protein
MVGTAEVCGERQTFNQVFEVEGFGLQGEGQGVNGKPAFPLGLQ